MERKRVAEAAKGVGRPKVGGPFSLLDQHGKEFTDEDMKGRYSLVRLLSSIVANIDVENRTELC
jgi:cytochrome oxidase Cu insertion factor (SCO1/SenC/PrrC family)